MDIRSKIARTRAHTGCEFKDFLAILTTGFGNMRKLSLALCCAALAMAQESRPGVIPPPHFPPSYQVHISPTGLPQGEEIGEAANYWVARGWDLRNMIAEAWHVDTSRLDIAKGVDAEKRYDFAMVLPKPEDRDTIYTFVRQAIQEQLHLRISSVPEPKDVFVLTAPNGLAPAVKLLPLDANAASTSHMEMTNHSISAHGITVQQLCHSLTGLLGKLIVDETHVDARLDIEVETDGHGRSGLIAMLHDKLGLVLTPAHRDVEMVVVQSSL